MNRRQFYWGDSLLKGNIDLQLVQSQDIEILGRV